MNHSISLIGLNHKTAEVDVREKFALTGVEDFELSLAGGPVREVLALSTCNRVEILTVGDDPEELERTVLENWAGACGRTPDELSPHVYRLRDRDAVEHLFQVASSLDSMVLGEPQILGQLKEAYRGAVESATARVLINRLLHKAFFVAKKVRTETDIASSAVSISYAAVELAKSIFGEMRGRGAMLIGAGEMAELAAQHLRNAGIERLFVANRTFERARELAMNLNGEPIAFENLYDHLHQVDIVISSTGAPHAVIMAREVKRVLKERRYRPMFFIDIAVPRDIDPDVNQLDNVYLYDIDDLKEVVEENMAQRQEQAELARDIVARETSAFMEWMRSLDLQPTIVDLLRTGEAIAERELAKTLRRIGPVDDETRRALTTMAHSITRKLYHEPLVFLKRRTREEGKADQFIDLARRMFNLDLENVPEDAHRDRKRDSDIPEQ